MAFAYSPKIVTNGLILYLDAANPYSYVSGSTTWNDLSRATNNGTLFNTPVYDSTFNGSFTFNGSTNYIAVPDAPSLQLAGDKTLTCWVNLTAVLSCGFAGKSNSTAKGMALGYGWSGGGFMALAWNSSNSPVLTQDTSRDLNKWNYLVATQSGSIRTIYAYDSIGVRIATSSAGTHTWANTQSLMIGNANNGTNMVPSGTRIANVSVYSRALTPDETMQNFNTQKSRFGL